MPLPSVVVFEDSHRLNWTRPTLTVIRQENSVPDAQIRLNRKHLINSHRVIIAARIPARKNRFGEPGADQAHIEHIIQDVIERAYTGQLTISLKNVEDFIYFAVDLRLIQIGRFCYLFLINRLTLDKFHFVMHIANHLQAGILQKACYNLIRSQLTNFVSIDMLYRLPLDNLLCLLQSNSLGVQNEEQVVKAICNWVLANDSFRATEAHAQSRVRWQNVGSQVQSDLLRKVAQFEMSPRARKLLNKLVKRIGLFHSDATGSTTKMRPVNLAEKAYMKGTLVTIGTPRLGDKREWIIQTYDPENGKDAIISRIKRRKNAAVVIYDDQIFIIGGLIGDCNTKLVKAFSAKTRRCRLAAPMATARGEAAASRVGHAIVVYGGSGANFKELASCELFLPSEDRWISLPPLSRARRASACVALGDGRLFAIGGLGDFEYLSSVEYCCQPELVSEICRWRPDEEGEDFWLPAAPMNRARCFHSACEHGGHVFVAGGLSHSSAVLKSVEMFQPPTAEKPLGEWTLVQSMNQAREDFSLVLHRNSLFALGHYLPPSDTVECFRPPNGQPRRSSTGEQEDVGNWGWVDTRSPSFIHTIEAAGSMPFAFF